jgi:hypothetical protein
MERQPNGYASVKIPTNDYSMEQSQKPTINEVKKNKNTTNTPFSHSMLIAVKRNVSPERDVSPI